MKTIELGHGYRLNRIDSMNWQLEKFRPAGTVEAIGKTWEVKDRWKPLGRYYQKLDAAIRAVYELVLRDGDDATDLKEALDRAEGIAATLRGAIDGN